MSRFIEVWDNEADDYVRVPGDGWYYAPTVDYSDAAITVARLVAERDAARKEVEKLRDELYKAQDEIKGLEYDLAIQPRTVKWAVRDDGDDTWLSEESMFYPNKNRRALFASKDAAERGLADWRAKWSTGELYRPVFVKVRCK